MASIAALAIAALGIAVAFGHSMLGERLIFAPMRADGAVRMGARFDRVVHVVFHLPSLIWVATGFAVLASSVAGGNTTLSLLAATIFAMSAIGNVLAVRRIHIGSILLTALTLLVLLDWQSSL